MPEATWQRHPADAARLAFALLVGLGLVLLGLVYRNTVVGLAADLVRLVDNVPGWLTSFVVGLLQLLAVVAPVVIVVGLAARRRFRVLSVLVAAAVLAGVSMALIDIWAGDRVPDVVQLNDRVDSWLFDATFPTGAYLAALTAVVTAGSPWLRRPWRRAAWWAVALAGLLRVLTATEVPFSLGLLIAVGSAAGSAVLLCFGAPSRRADPEAVSEALAGCGLEVTSIERVDEHAASPVYLAETTDGQGLRVVVVGRDERDTDALLHVWQALRVKGLGDDRPAGRPSSLVEHAALASSMARVTGARVSAAVAVASTAEGAGVLVEELVDGPSLASLAADEIADDALVDLWRQVDMLHRRGIAHRWLDTAHVRLVDGAPVIVDFRSSVLSASAELRDADVAELLASLALIVGVDRTVATAARVLDPSALAGALALLQPVVLHPATRAPWKAQSEQLDELRTAVQHAAGLESYELAEVHRITLKGVVSLVGGAVLGYYLISLASDWQSIWDTLQEANWALLPWLLVLSALSYVGGGISLIGAVTTPLAFGRTIEVMFAQSYLNRFTPANAGGMALRARYLQLSGTELTVAAAAVGLTSMASGVVQAVYLVLFAVWGGTTSAFANLSTPSASVLLLIAVAVGAAVGFLVLSSFGRRVALPWVRRTRDKVVGSIRDLAKRPSKMGELFGGAAMAKLVTIAAFAVSVRALGVDMPFVQAAALYMVANTIGSAVPTPGGVGGIEAALTAALLSVGVASATAASIVLLFRLATFWLPTLPGYLFLRRVQRQGIV